MKLSKVTQIWDELHKKNTGEVGYCDLETAIEGVDGIENDINPSLPEERKEVKDGRD